MKKLCLLFVLTLPAFAQAGNAFVGRWDLTLTSPRGSWPQWMEIVEKDGKLDGRIQPRGGAVRPIVASKLEGGHLLVTVQAAGRGPEISWDLTASGDKLTGVQKQGDNAETKIAGVRAPKLDRPMPKAWTAPEPLFNGKDLTGWEPIGNASNNHWVARAGELINESKGANIRTTRTFNDFKLHIEYNCPANGNSGIYLRGRYEVQVEYEPVDENDRFHSIGAIYSFLAPAVALPRKPGTWESFDITLVGRHVTIVRDGVKTIDNQEIPGITGGALDSHEAEPGPIYIQGDHTGGMKYRNITISLPK